ncbi:RNA polymerase subunit sigma-70 [Nocardia aurantia]|uniref:RNA polymerase sigma factor n=1 Tax=Nocardia aurantia TaxID=2585199 RepID=A0A7K0DSM5_9NOCA|nr:RNA polymerase subunit sigma-70 [Nocardia aurantia]MQY28773.1 ECF RNA polymerase sigma factor SigG [Nocardia aurantia]
MADQTGFAQQTEPFRRELLAHCYRMLGSVHDAEDLVQETYLLAWRGFDGFQGRSSVRAWLYRIATNACLKALQRRSIRLLPSGLGGPAADPLAPPVAAGSQVAWLEPIPDAMIGVDDPADVAATREGIRLALIACLQHLSAPQRAVLLLRDVLAFPADEVAVMLETTTPAVKSTLQRARARLRQLDPSEETPAKVDDPRARELLNRYVTAFEAADVAALEQLFSAEATLEATTIRTWFAGRTGCLHFLHHHILGAPGDWRMLPTRANGAPAALAFHRTGDTYRPYGIVVLTVADDAITGVVSFADPALIPLFTRPGDSPGNGFAPLRHIPRSIGT